MDDTIEGRFSFGRFVMAVWLFFLLGALFFGFGVAVFLTTSKQDDAGLRYAMAVVSSAAGAASLGFCTVQFLRRTSRLEIRPDGLSWVTGGRPGSAAWADVRSVYRDEFYTVMTPDQQGSEWMRRAHVRVIFQNGTRVTFRQTLTNFDALAGAIQRYATEAVLAAKLAELSEKGEAGFGSVAVGPNGVRVAGRLYPWAEINYAFSRGWLCVAPARDEFDIAERRDVPLSALPNYLALVALMAHVGKPPVDPLLIYPASWRKNMAGRV
jgi:hypothetical protein